MEVQFPDPSSVEFLAHSSSESEREAWMRVAAGILKGSKEAVDWSYVQSMAIGMRFLQSVPEVRDAIIALSHFPVRKAGKPVKRDDVVRMINNIISV